MATREIEPEIRSRKTSSYVGTIVGESTSQEFRLAVAHESIREQDIVAVDSVLRDPDGNAPLENIRVWAKVQRIERVNPLFPLEAGHELAATRTDPLDTVLSLSREMVTAVCRVLGAEQLQGDRTGSLDQLRYPAQPATSAYRPEGEDLTRVLLGDLRQREHRAIDLATLSNRDDIDVHVDGHSIVTRHLAILAMTGAGKSWTARRIIEQLAAKRYPIVIFDPHGDYSRLGDMPEVRRKVHRYYARFPVFEESAETVIQIVESLGRQLAKTHIELFDQLFDGARRFRAADAGPSEQRSTWLSNYLGNPKIAQFGLGPDLFALADVAQAMIKAFKEQDLPAQATLGGWALGSHFTLTRQQAGYLEGLPGNLRYAAKRLHQMEVISRKAAGTSDPLPLDRTSLVAYDQISILSLAGYPGEFQALIYSLIAEQIFSAKVSDVLKLPVLLVLEEAHNFAPGQATTAAEKRAITTTKQIAQEGRKFRTGLVLISQRPSRLDETTLSQCNSFVIMRMVNPADQNFVKRVVETLGEDEARMLPDLDVGEAILSGQLVNFPVLVRIKEPISKGEREEEDAFKELEDIHREQSGTVAP